MGGSGEVGGWAVMMGELGGIKELEDRKGGEVVVVPVMMCRI